MRIFGDPGEGRFAPSKNHPKGMNFSFLALFFAAKASSKTVTVKFVCWEYRDVFQRIVVVSPTCFNGDYNFLIGKNGKQSADVHPVYDPSIVEDLLISQSSKVAKGQTCPVLLILDDCVSSLKMNSPTENPELTKLWTCNRHFQISVICTAQYPKAVPIIARNCADFVILGRNLPSAYSKIYQEFGSTNLDENGRPQTEKDFVELLVKGTQNFGWFLYNAHTPEQHLTGPWRVPKSFVDAPRWAIRNAR